MGVEAARSPNASAGRGGRWFRGLWRDPDFLRLWTGQSVSLLGSQISELALPLTASVDDR